MSDGMTQSKVKVQVMELWKLRKWLIWKYFLCLLVYMQSKRLMINY